MTQLQDRQVALLDFWKQIFRAIQADLKLGQQYDLSKLSEFIASQRNSEV